MTEGMTLLSLRVTPQSTRKQSLRSFGYKWAKKDHVKFAAISSKHRQFLPRPFSVFSAHGGGWAGLVFSTPPGSEFMTGGALLFVCVGLQFLIASILRKWVLCEWALRVSMRSLSLP